MTSTGVTGEARDSQGDRPSTHGGWPPQPWRLPSSTLRPRPSRLPKKKKAKSPAALKLLVAMTGKASPAKAAEGDPAAVLADPHVKRAYLGEEDEVLVDPDDVQASSESAA